MAAKKARKNGTRVIYTAHGFHFYKGASKLNWMLFYPIEKWLAKYTDTLITINKEDYELAKNKFSKRCHDIQYVPGVGIDTKKIQTNLTEKEKNNFKKSLGLSKNDFVLTCVARLDKNKNQGFLIDVMEKLVYKNKDIYLLLVGPDELNGYYQKMVDDKNLNNNIHFLGRREDIPNILAITDVVVSASLREGLPVNVIEAFAAGKPVLALDCRGMKELIENGKNGYIIENNKKLDNFSTLIIKIYNDRKNINKTAINILEKSKRFDIYNVINYMSKIYFKKKIILHLLASNKFSGAENVVCTIITNMLESYDMIYCSPNGIIKEQLKLKDIRYMPIKKLTFNEVKKIIKDIHPDIIHAHDNKATVVSSFFHNKCKIVSHIHGNNKIMNTLNLKTIFFNLCSRNINKFIWVSNSSFDDYYFKKSIRNKSIVLYNVIDSKQIISKSNAYKCKEIYDLIYLGRLGYPKNPERLIEIVRILKEKKLGIKVAIVGDGNERNNIEKLIDKYYLRKNIKMFGFQNNPYPILKNSKILIMTSIYEGTPMCALEAQSLGIPIVSTPVDGLKKLITNDYNGLCSNDNEEIVDFIIKLLSNESLYLMFSKNTIESFKNNNNLNDYLNRIDNIYYNLFYGGNNDR